MVLDRFGGGPGTRNYAGLKVACEAPVNIAQTENGDLFDQAAAYAFSIIQNHPYYDGNRSTGLTAALVFLGLNGCGNHKYYEPLLQEAVLYLAEQKMTRAQFANTCARRTTVPGVPGGTRSKLLKPGVRAELAHIS